MIPTLLETVTAARKARKAVGHFNISNIEGLNAIFAAAKKLNVPVIIGASEGERDFIGVPEVVALVKAIRDEHQYPIYLNADHTYSFARVKEAVDAGFDSVIIDGAKLPVEENIAMTKQCVEYVKEYVARTGRPVTIEAELGYIGQSSKLLDKLPDGVGVDPKMMTSPEEAKSFIDATGIDMFAPSVGNVHGIVLSGEPKLNIDLIKRLAATVSIPLVLHGASGITSEELSQAVEGGISIVHYNTEVRLAYRDAMKKSLVEQDSHEVAPYKIAAGAVDAMEKVVEEKLRIMNRM